MSDKEIAAIAEKARMIVSGYAFTMRQDGFISILNLSDEEIKSEGNNELTW